MPQSLASSESACNRAWNLGNTIRPSFETATKRVAGSPPEHPRFRERSLEVQRKETRFVLRSRAIVNEQNGAVKGILGLYLSALLERQGTCFSGCQLGLAGCPMT